MVDFHNVYAIIRKTVQGADSWEQEYENILATGAVSLVLAAWCLEMSNKKLELPP